MKHTFFYRRHLAALALGVLSIGAAYAEDAASTWPTKPGRLVVAFPAGGLADVMARILVPQLNESLGQPVLIDNRSGASGNIAAVEMIRNGSDGHTFMVNVTTIESANPVMFERMPFDPAKDLQHVALLANTQLFLVTRPNFPANNLKEFVAYAKANPGKLSYGSAGNGTTPHIGGELFKQSAGVVSTHLPYRGAAPAIQDLMAGQIDYGFMPGTVFQSVKAGKLKLLAVASRQRTANFSSAVTVEEEGFGKVFVDTPFAVYATFKAPGYDPLKDFTALAGVATYYNVMALSSAISAKTPAEFGAWLKANPGKANYGIPAVGSVPQFAGLLVGKALGTPMVSIPYRGGAPLVQDLLGGQVPATFLSLTESIEHHRSGKMHVMAVSGTSRAKSAPDIPTFQELGIKGLDKNPWLAFFGPKGMAPEFVDRFSRAVASALADPEVVEKLSKLGNVATYANPEQLNEWVTAATLHW